MAQGHTSRMRRAVFVDRDGTISHYLEYCRRPEDFQLLPRVGWAIRTLNRAGLLVVVITNQSAIARGFLTEQTLESIHQKLHQELKRVGAWVDAIYVCPHQPQDGCVCRKPRTGMLQQAAQDLGVSLGDSYVIGDRQLDVRLGHAVGSTTILVRTGHRPEPMDGVLPDYEAATLHEAVQWILQREGVRPVEPTRQPTQRVHTGHHQR